VLVDNVIGDESSNTHCSFLVSVENGSKLYPRKCLIKVQCLHVVFTKVTLYRFPSDLIYHDFVKVADGLSAMLRDPQGPHQVDIVIALTHMRVPNDVKLATSCFNSVDLILGG
jgi:hypothetical protein